MQDSDNDDDCEESNWKSKPDFWSDDVRMNALFAPFRNRDLNPLHYDNKLKFWKQAVSSYCKENQLIQFDLNLIVTSFKRKNLKPKCLDLVINEMIKDATIKTIDDALKPKPGLIQNIFNKVVWSPLAWSTTYVLSQTPLNFLITSPTKTKKSEQTLSSSFSSPNCSFRSPTSPRSPSFETTFIGESNDRVLVNINLLESKSQELINILNESVVYRNVDCVISFDELKIKAQKLLNKTSLVEDLDLIIKYLEVNKKFLTFVEPRVNNQKYIKFTSNLYQNVTPVTEVESSYANLKESQRIMDDESSKLNEQIESINKEIITLMKQNNKNQALKLLKKRKQIELKLEKKDAAISNIETLMTSFQQADTNKMTYDVFSQSASALKEANKAVNIDKLDDTVADLQDMISANAEIEEVLRTPLSKQTYDDQELNTELNEILSAEKEEAAKTEKLKELDAKYVASKETKKVPKLLDFDQDQSFNMNDLLESLPNITQIKSKLSSTSS